MKNLKIKIIVGYRKDQHYTIEADEAHKAYYLFLNPDQRGVFKNGVALIGSNIQGIEPDYNASMGWNPLHNLDADDWSELRASGKDRELRDVLQLAREVATYHPEQINLPLSEIKQLDDGKTTHANGAKALLDNTKR